MKLSWCLIALILSWPAYGGHYCNKTRVAVLDTGLNLTDPRFTQHLCPTGHKNFVLGETINDIVGHGTHVSGIIEQFADGANYCMLIYKYFSYHATGIQNVNREVQALNEAILNEADIVNFSGGGDEPNQEEYSVIKNNPRVVFVVAAGNDHKNLNYSDNTYFPASYWLKNEYVIGASDSSSSNYGSKVLFEPGYEVLSYLPNNQLGRMSGSSMSTARFTGKLVDRVSKMCND